ncbi:MAG: hypothetical protein Q9167_002943 [Letrouitia subvulpina]
MDHTLSVSDDNSAKELILAVIYNNVPLLETLLAQGSNANAIGQVVYNFEKASKANEGLLYHNAPIFSLASDTSQGRPFIGSALEAALFRGNCDATKLLLQYGAHVTTNWTALISPIRCGNLQLIRILHEHRKDYQKLFCPDALHMAVEYGHQDTVKFFLECGVGVPAGALQLAACRQGPILGLLLESRGDLESWSYDYAMLRAVEHMNTEAIQLLVRHGADINARDQDGNSCLRTAVYEGNGKMVKFLLEHGAAVTIQPSTEGRDSLLHIAVKRESIAIVKTLCENGGGIYFDTQDERGHTPLHCAILIKNIKMVRYLLDRGASPDLLDFESICPLKLALNERLREIVLLLYPKSKADPSPVTASELRRCSPFGDQCNLEIIGGQEPSLLFRDTNLIYDLCKELNERQLSYTEIKPNEKLDKIEELDLYRKERRA